MCRDLSAFYVKFKYHFIEVLSVNMASILVIQRVVFYTIKNRYVSRYSRSHDSEN